MEDEVFTNYESTESSSTDLPIIVKQDKLVCAATRRRTDDYKYVSRSLCSPDDKSYVIRESSVAYSRRRCLFLMLFLQQPTVLVKLFPRTAPL
jgi:hypothetical protein